MIFDEWLEAYYSGTQIDDETIGMMRTAFDPVRGVVIGDVVEWAYKYADAMLEEREK